MSRCSSHLSSSKYLAPISVSYLPIPETTWSEQVQKDKEQVQEIFKGEDLSGLEISSRKRRYSCSNIEELLALEFETTKEQQKAQLLNICVQNHQESEYKMRLLDDSKTASISENLEAALQTASSTVQPSNKKKIF